MVYIKLNPSYFSPIYNLDRIDLIDRPIAINQI